MSGIFENVGFYLMGTDRERLSIARRGGRTPPDEPGDWPYPDEDDQAVEDRNHLPEDDPDDDMIFA